MTNERSMGCSAGRPGDRMSRLTPARHGSRRLGPGGHREVVLRLARELARETGQKNLCLAGGVALNCVANGKILRDGCFERIWIQPAAGDAGGALGAVLRGLPPFKDQPRKLNGAHGWQGRLSWPELRAGGDRAAPARGRCGFEVLADERLIGLPRTL